MAVINPIVQRYAADPVAPGPEATGGTGLVCILSRKDLRNITRVTRMAKALSDSGYGVIVVSLAAPVQELRDLAPTVEYLEVAPRPFTGQLLSFLNGRVLRRTNRRSRRARLDGNALVRGGWHALAVHGRRLLTAPFAWAGELVRRLFLAAPCAVLLRKPEQDFAAAWHELSQQQTAAILGSIVRSLHQQAMTRAFAGVADKATRDQVFQIVQAHDNYALLAAARLARRDEARLIYDAVEITEHRLATSFTPLERLFERYERRQEVAIFRKADAVTTIGKGVGEWCVRNYRIAPPLVVRNCRYYWQYEKDLRLRADAGIGPDVPLIVWFGGIYPQQGVETLIDALQRLSPDIHLAIIAYVLPRWVHYTKEELPKRAADRGVADRVHFLPPRSPGDLVPYVSGADLGVIPRPSGHPNNFYSMPNKFLEMVMARLPIAVSRLGDIVEVVDKYGIGQSFDEEDLGDMAAVIGHMLDRQINRRLKANVMKAAEEMTWEKESVPYVALVRALTLRTSNRANPAP
jgi:glycosyltransferase involved in cell wall biosynthesis